MRVASIVIKAISQTLAPALHSINPPGSPCINTEDKPGYTSMFIATYARMPRQLARLNLWTMHVA